MVQLVDQQRFVAGVSPSTTLPEGRVTSCICMYVSVADRSLKGLNENTKKDRNDFSHFPVTLVA